MGTYNVDWDLKDIETKLHVSIIGSPIELQLVWLYELLSLLLFVRVSRGKPHAVRKTSGGFQSVSLRKCRKMFKPVTFDLIMALGEFRNDYVHKGGPAAYQHFIGLKETRNAINEVAAKAKVSLNWDKSLYAGTCK